MKKKKDFFGLTKKIISNLLVFSTAAALFSGCGNVSASDSSSSNNDSLKTIRLGVWTGGVDQFIAVVGQEQGIFEKHGLKVDTTEFGTGIESIDAVVTGQDDIGLVSDYALVYRIGNTKDNFDGKIIARYTTTKDWGFYVKPDEVKSLSDLSGKPIAINQGTIVDYFTSITFDKAGVPEDERKTVNIDSMSTAVTVLSSGQAAGYWTTGPTAKKLTEYGFTKLIGLSDIDLSVDGYYVSSKSFASEHEKTIENFFSAVSETESWIKDNEDDAAEIVTKKTNIPKDQVIATIDSGDLVLDLKQDSNDHLIALKDWALKQGNFKNDFNIEDFVDTTALKNVFPDSVE